MRNIEEQISIVTRRVDELKQAKKRRNCRILSLSSVAACFVIIITSALAMPNIMGKMSETEYNKMTGFASIFSNGNAMGYLLIALLGFMLGVCITILCVYLHKRSLEDKKNN